MIFYFTEKKTIGSRLIKWGTDSPVSHFAWGTRLDPYSIVVESRAGHGVEPIWQKTFMKRNRVVAVFYRNEPDNLTNRVYKSVIDKIEGHRYDWKAVLFWSLATPLLKLGAKITRNNWQDKNATYCSEVLKSMRYYFAGLRMDLSPLDEDFLSPGKALEWIRDSGKFKEISI